MATVRRLAVTRWYLPDPSTPAGRREVKPNTPGATKEQATTSTYYVVWKERVRTKRQATGLTDKRAAQRYLSDWNTARERGQLGLADPYAAHLDRDVLDHLTDYIAAITATSRTDRHPKQVDTTLRYIFAAAQVHTLRDLTPHLGS